MEHTTNDRDALRPSESPAEPRTAPGRIPARDILALQRAAGNEAVSSLLETADPAAAVSAALGSGTGRPLDAGVRSSMEQQFGHDFSDVRIHTGGAAARSAQLLSAHAYTVGSDIVFDSGQYDPVSAAGQRTIAHELTHVVQQRQGPVAGTAVSGGLQVSDPGDPFERQAEDVASRIAPST